MIRPSMTSEPAPDPPVTPGGAVARALPVGQAAGGALMIWRPGPLARAVSSAPSNVPALWVLRLLGLRLLAQGITGALWPRPEVAAVSAMVDATHSASMALAAMVTPRFRRPALISAAVALASAAISAQAAAPGRGRTR